MLVVGILAGLILIGLAWFGAGRFIRYVPVPVVEGFTLGIAAIIGLQQVPALLGTHAEGEKVLGVAFDALGQWAHHLPGHPSSCRSASRSASSSWRACAPGCRGPWWSSSWPRWRTRPWACTSGTSGPSPPACLRRRFPWSTSAALDDLILPAVAVAALAALESLLSATVADGMSVGQRHDPDRELLGQGIANLAAPLFGGIPATAAIARTAVNVRSGAASRLASVSHAVVLLIVVLVAARWVGMIPVAALAGVLIATAVQMVRFSSLGALMRSTRGDATVLA